MKSKEWHSGMSLEQYFPEDHVSKDEVEIFKFLVDFFKKNHSRFEKVLDFGAGPVIHRLVPAVPYVKKIYISEYLSESILEVKKWLKGQKNARNWDFYIKKVLEIEGKESNNQAISRRRRELRRKIVSLAQGDIFKDRPLAKNARFPLVLSFYCADAVTGSKAVWRRLMKNLSGLVAPGGWFIVSASAETAYSMLGDKKMPNVKLNKMDVYKVLVKLGYLPETIDIRVIDAKIWKHVGITKVLVAKAKKP